MDWILRRARIADNAPLQDIAIQRGCIAVLGPNLPLTAAEEWDLAGRVVLPGLVDIHTHLDKTYSTTTNKSGTLLEAIDVWRQASKQRSPADAHHAASQALRNAVSHGVTALRSHLDVGSSDDLPVIEALLALRDELRSEIDLQFVTLAHVGASREQDSRIEQALALGVGLVGGAPSLTPNPQATVAATFRLAERLGLPIDLHVDETEDPRMLILETVAEQTLAYGMQGRVTAGHCCSLAFVDNDTATRVMDKVAQAQMTLVTLPSCNLVLMGRAMSPAPRGVTRVKELLARGVNVCAASDNVRDPFNPFGAYDLLQIANLNAHVAHLTGEAELYASLEMVTGYPARTFGAVPGAISEGARADLVVVEAQRLLDVVLYPPARLATFKAGKLIVRTSIEQKWYG